MQIAIALAWEFWARGWQAILAAQAGAIAFMFLIYGTTSWEGGVTFRGTDAGRAMQFGFYWFVVITVGSSVLVSLGNPVRRYTLPASSLMLVGCPMACAMGASFALYAMIAVLLNAVFDAGWAVIGPGLLAAVLAAWGQAILWSASNSLVLQVFACLGSFAVAIVAFERTQKSVLQDFNPSHPWLFILATIVCFAVGTAGFANLRRGSGLEFERIISWLDWRRWRADHAIPFRSPASAQFWLEFADRGYSLPLGTAMIGIVMLIVAGFWPPVNTREFVFGVSYCVVSLACLVGMFLGLRSERGEFGNFNGSRPLTDSQIAGAVLKGATFSLLVSAVIWICVLIATIWILGESLESSPAVQTIRQLDPLALLCRVLIGAVVIWSIVGLVTSACLAGKNVMATAFFLPFGLALVGVMASKYLFSGEARATFSLWYSHVCFGLCMLLAAAIYITSFRLRLISWKTLSLAVAIAALTIVAAQYGRDWNRPLPLAALCGCCMLPVPLAAAPLAVWFNRHR